jgi:hypothetical protein
MYVYMCVCIYVYICVSIYMHMHIQVLYCKAPESDYLKSVEQELNLRY